MAIDPALTWMVSPLGIGVRLISGRDISSCPPAFSRKFSPAVVVIAMRRVRPLWRFTPKWSASGRSCFSSAASHV
jgi:hypothetical protein